MSALQIARRYVDAATDLAGTHLDPKGALKGSANREWALLGWSEQVEPLARIAALAGGVEPLALRCFQAGVTAPELERHLSLRDRVVELSWAIGKAANFQRGDLANLTLRRPGIRLSDPASEWSDRVSSVRDAMRAHIETGRVAVGTLRDVARLATVASHILATSGTVDFPAQSMRTQEWQGVLERLAPLTSTELPDRQVREHIEHLLVIASPIKTADRPGERAHLLGAVAASAIAIDECSEMAERLASRSVDIWAPPKPAKPYLRPIRGFGDSAVRVAFPDRWPRPLLVTSRDGPGIA